MSDQKPIEFDKDRRLNKAINNLAGSEPTSTDLWPSIKQRVETMEQIEPNFQSEQQPLNNDSATNTETKLSLSRWQNWAIAASLVLCVGSVSYSSYQLEKAKAVFKQANSIKGRMSSTLVKFEPEVQTSDSFIDGTLDATYLVRQVDEMEKEYKAAKASLMARISMNRTSINEALFTQIETELMEIARATLMLKKAMGRQPVDLNFTHLLRATYQQELNVLTQLAKLDTTI